MIGRNLLNTIFTRVYRLNLLFYMFFFDDQFPPQSRKVFEGGPEVFRPKKLRLAIRAVIVIDGDFGKFVTRVLEFLDHLEADRAGMAFERDLIEYLPPNQAKVAVHIS